MATGLLDFEITGRAGQATYEYAGTVGNNTIGAPSHPKWKVATSLSYTNGPSLTTLRWRYIGPQSDSDRVVNPAITDPSAPRVSYFDLEQRFTVAERFQFRVGVNNLLDKNPPLLALPTGFTDPSTYDILGRRFYAGARLTF